MKTKHMISSLACSLVACLATPCSAEEPESSTPAVFGGLMAADKLIADKKWDEAEQTLRALIRDPGVEPDHPAVGTLHLKQAELYQRRNQSADAFAAAAAAVPIFEKALGRENPFSMAARWIAAQEALKAGKPLDSAQHAALLQEILKEYVGSGRAAAAQWETVPDFNKLLAILPRFDESGIAAVSSLLGRAWAAAGERDKAAPVLKEAVALLEKLHGPGHPDLVAVQQNLETIAAARGEASGRRYVGDLGSTRKLMFEGNRTFPAEELRKALGMDVGYVMASHPSAEFADFPPVIQKALHRGYLNEGFPKAVVEVTRGPARDGGCLVVKISEGPRYLMGEIRIAGTREVNPEDLLRKLVVVETKDHDGSLAGMVSKMMNGYAKLLPQPDVKAATAMVEAMNQQIPSFKMEVAAGNQAIENQPETDLLANLKSSSSTTEADWIPGEPMAFSEPAQDPMLDTVRQRLAELGRPLARLQTSHEFNDDGTVDLVIKVEDEGPVAVIGKVHVIGSEKNTAEEVTKASGLVPGQPFTPQAIDLATVALWNTGRFFPFTVIPQPQGHENKEIDITIQAREIAGVPTLSDPLKPELETARRFIATLNEWLATGDFTDFQWSSKTAGGDERMLGISSHDGLIVEIRGADSGIHLALSMSRQSIHFELLSGDRHGRGSLPGVSEFSAAFVHVLPTEINDGKVQFGTGFGYSSKARGQGKVLVDLLITPALPLLKPDKFRLDGDHVLFVEGDAELLRLDRATALPVAGTNNAVEFRDGIVRKRQADMAAELAMDADPRFISDWIEAFDGFARFTGIFDNDDKELEQQFGSWLRLASYLLKPETLRPFKEIYAKWSESINSDKVFTIPLDPLSLQGEAGTMSLLVGLGAITFSEMIAPADSWVSKLSRELVFIYGGKTQYTSRTINELLADPSIGPYGCIMISQLLGKFDAGTSRRFLAKALEQASEGGFRRDWRFWLDSPTGLGKTIDEFLTALAAITPEEEKTAADLLEPAQAEWFHGILSRLRQRPDGEKLADWIAPQMDGLWNNVIGDSLRKDLESQLGPAADPTQVAAMVNGQPVRRILVRAINDVFLGQGILQPATEDATRPWTKDPALSLAIRLTLLEQDMLRRGFTIQESQVKDMLARGFPELMDQPDEEWIAATGMKQEEYGHIIGKSMVLNTITTMVTNSVKKTSDSDIEAFYQKHSGRISRKAHLHMIVADRGDGRSLTRATHAARLARQTAAAMDAGLPFGVMTAATQANSRSGLIIMCEPDNAYLALSASLRAALETMEPGESTQPMAAGNKTIMIRFEGWKNSEPLPLEEIRQKLAGLIHENGLRQSLDATCRQQESRADIIILENPEPGAAEASVFNELLKSDSFGEVGQLGVFWDHVRSNVEDAADHLQKLIDSGFMDPPDLVLLADALLAHDQKPLAAMCVTEAADRDDQATRKAIANAVSRHRIDGNKGQQDQLETLVPKRQ
jgi:hypothetical protein